MCACVMSSNPLDRKLWKVEHEIATANGEEPLELVITSRIADKLKVH